MVLLCSWLNSSIDIIAGINGWDLLPTLAKEYDKEKYESLSAEEKQALKDKYLKHKSKKINTRRVTAIRMAMCVEKTVNKVTTKVSFAY